MQSNQLQCRKTSSELKLLVETVKTRWMETNTLLQHASNHITLFKEEHHYAHERQYETIKSKLLEGIVPIYLYICTKLRVWQTQFSILEFENSITLSLNYHYIRWQQWKIWLSTTDIIYLNAQLHVSAMFQPSSGCAVTKTQHTAGMTNMLPSRNVFAALSHMNSFINTA